MSDVSRKTDVPGPSVLSQRNRKAALTRHRNARARRHAETVANIKDILRENGLTGPGLDAAAAAIVARWVA